MKGSRARPNSIRRAYLAAIAAVGVGACTSPPSLPEGRLARIETVPAGARLITEAGEVFRTPAVLPITGGATQRIELRLPGYAPRRIAIVSSPNPTPLGAMGLCTLVPLLAEAHWERIAIVDSFVRVHLEPLPPPEVEGKERR